MTKQMYFPALMGAAMGLMMLRLGHNAMTSADAVSLAALIGFAFAHVAVLAVLIGGGALALRLSPHWRARFARLHRPSWRHLLTMIAAALTAAALAHLILHGGL